MTSKVAEKWKINAEMARLNLETIQAHPRFIKNLQAAHKDRNFSPVEDPDLMIYSGGFFSNNDRARMEVVHETQPEELGELDLPFDDSRLTEMLFRYRARNYPETLGENEQVRWDDFRTKRLTGLDAGSNNSAGITMEEFRKLIADLRHQNSLGEEGKLILDGLEEYAQLLLPD